MMLYIILLCCLCSAISFRLDYFLGKGPISAAAVCPVFLDVLQWGKKMRNVINLIEFFSVIE